MMECELERLESVVLINSVCTEELDRVLSSYKVCSHMVMGLQVEVGTLEAVVECS
jgi:hypothetical protein